MTCIDDLHLSESQRAVLLDPSSRILVSAGAGSGKTRLLVAYFVHALVDCGVPPQDLVAVTFTRKAAAELAARIQAELVVCGRADLARAVDLSTIGTIHSLCRRLIKEHAFEAVVDPAFSVMEAETAAMIKEEVSELVWKEMIEEASEDELGVLATHESNLRRAIVSVYDRLRAAGQECPSLPMASLVTPEQAGAGLAAAIQRALEAAEGLQKRSATLEKDLCLIGSCLGWLEGFPSSAPLPQGDGSAVTSITEAAAAFFPSRRTAAMEEWFEPVRKALTSYRSCLAGLEGQPVVEAMNGLLARFHARYTAEKRAQGTLDFADLELRALALVNERAGRGTAFFGPGARVLVDEFQDTNELQCAVLENLGSSNMVMVGDERQSIYRFRGADVEVFRRREARLAGDRDEPGGDEELNGGLHWLSDNYRSSKQILGFVNRLFADERFFGSRFVGLNHARDEEGRKRPADRVVDVLTVERADADDPEAGTLLIQEAESEAVAWQVRRLIDEENWEPRDIAVLTPALTHSGTIEESLAAQRIDTYLVRGKGYYSREEVSDVRALLQILVNPHDDLALVVVLRSPVVGLSDDALYLLGREARRGRTSLWEAVSGGRARGLATSDLNALQHLVQGLSALVDRVGRPGLARFVDDAVSAFTYDLRALASDQGDRRFANIRKLMRLADQYESTHGPDLSGFVAVTQSMGDLTDSEGSAPTLAEGENVVRIMTVHQAKGLEFPVVVLTGLGSEPRVGRSSQFVVAPDGRAGVFFRDTRRRPYEDHDLCWGPGVEIVEQEKAQERQEDLRLLYVAMTRAEDRLVLVGAAPKHGNLEANRIGRIVAGLRLDSLPQPGETVELEELGAAVTSFIPPKRSPSFGDTSGASAAAAPAEELAEAVGGLGTIRPRFLETGPAVVLPRRLSFSALAAFRECPRRFYLERVLGLRVSGPDEPGAPRPPQDDRTASELEEVAEDSQVWLDEGEINVGRDIGLLVHGLLERLPLHEPCPDVEQLRSMASRLSFQGGALLAPSDLDRALALTEAFWLTPVSSRTGLARADKEVAFCFVREGIVLSGIMDLAWQEGDSWFIVDYKTNALRGRSPAEVAAGYELQSCVYSLAALRAGARDVSMEFLFLERPEEPIRLKCSSDDLTRLEEKLDTVLAEIRKGDFPPVRGVACEGCPLDGICSGLR